MQARGIRNQNFPTKLRLTYFKDQHLVLDLQYKDETEWTSCFTAPNVQLPGVVYLGFTAETGELSDNHDIISVNTKNLYPRGPPSGNTNTAGNAAKGSTTKPIKLTPKKQVKEGGSWMGLLFKFFIFGGVMVGCYVGFTVYRSTKRSSRF